MKRAALLGIGIGLGIGVGIGVVACGSREEAKPPPAPAPPAAPPAPAPPAVPAPPLDREALLAGKLPTAGAEIELINSRCQICHTTEYLTQQRLSEPAWKKAIEKMRKFGTPLSDAEVASLAAYAAKLWNPDLPGRTWAAGPPPAGALPASD
ncbi:MAG TPA: cytochrome c [Kofleriaceae bacterium]|nr:cytochrome c [Kofleriaceae bacterium]